MITEILSLKLFLSLEVGERSADIFYQDYFCNVQSCALVLQDAINRLSTSGFKSDNLNEFSGIG